VNILFAIESGSRLWRIPSKDSDFDVRFVFVRPLQDYLRIHKLPDVIEHVQGNMDFVGFDIYKFTNLFLNSNPSIIEWLKSDIIYIDGKTKQFFLNFIEKKFNPLALYHHYKSMCKQNYLKYLKSSSNITHKKYLYSMRGIINAMWVVQFETIPPVDFSVTFEKVKVPLEIKNELGILIKTKKQGLEKLESERIELFDTFIENFLKTEHQIETRRILGYSEIQEYIYTLLK
jgi:predicted nucleotidyltransferase